MRENCQIKQTAERIASFLKFQISKLSYRDYYKISKHACQSIYSVWLESHTSLALNELGS